jgi:hypothetical protein
MKFLLKKVGKDVSGIDFRLALLAWRNAPRADGVSPAFAFYGRNLRTPLPDARGPLLPVATAVEQAPAGFPAARHQAALRAAVRVGGQVLAPLAAGDRVHYQKMGDGRWFEGGEVQEMLTDRSYQVTTPEGSYRKNRRHLRRAVAAVPQASVALPEVEIEVEAPLLPAWLGSRVPTGPRRSRRTRHVTFRL